MYYSTLLRPLCAEGMNKIRIGTVKGSWAVWDCIRLEVPESMRLGAASSSLIRSVKSAPFEYEKEGKRLLPIWVDMVQFDTPRELTFRIGKEVVTRTVEAGESIQEFCIPDRSSVFPLSVRK